MIEDPTLAHLDGAVREAINMELGDKRYVTDWVIMTAHFDMDTNDTRYSIFTSESPPHHINGLIDTCERTMMLDEDEN